MKEVLIMTNKFFVNFNRSEKFANKADIGEKIGNIGLGLLRIGFGKTVKVENISNVSNIFITKSQHSTLAKVAAVALFIFALPITALLAGIGCIGTACSNSYGQIFDLFSQGKTVTRIVHPDTPEDNSATIIQKYIRGYLARKHFLPNRLFPQYHAQCQKANGPELHTMPRAETGKTTCYLPKDLPEVVLKRSGRKDAIRRFHQMQEVRAILESQNCSNLVIPKARLCGDFLVEQRLPINPDSYHNMELYLSHSELFDKTVREMTRLFSKVYLGSLVTWNYNSLGYIEGVGDFVKYDNLPLYIEEKDGKQEGKIGLIDLEHIQNKPRPQALKRLVRIFPLHLDIIKDEAGFLKMKFDEKTLDYYAEKGKKYLQVGFTDHLDWLQQKGVSNEVSLQPFEISTEREKELTNLVEKGLLKLNQGVHGPCSVWEEPPKNFFAENPEPLSKDLALIFTPMIIANIKAQIEKNQKEKLSKLSTQYMTDSELVSIRSPMLEQFDLYDGVDKLIRKNLKIKLTRNEGERLAGQLVHVVMEELVKGGELFFFDLATYDAGGYDICWLRY